MPQVTVRLTGDEHKLFQSYQRVIQQEAKLQSAGAETDRRSRHHARRHEQAWTGASQKVVSGLKDIAATLVGGVGVAAAVSRIVTLTRQWYEGMERVAAASAKAGREVTALAMMQAPGQAGTAARRAAALGAQFGVRPGEAWNVVQQLQAQTGGLETGIAGARAAFELSKFAGVETGAAGRAVSILMAKGMDPRGAVSAVYKSGELSSLSPEEITGAIPTGLIPYEKPELGLGIMAVLSRTIKEPGMLGTYTMRARQGLMGAQYEPFWKEKGLGKVGPLGRLRALSGMVAARGANYGQGRAVALAGLGFTEERVQRALGLLVQDPGGVGEMTRGIGEAARDPLLISSRRLEAEAEIPQMIHARQMDVAAATLEAEQAMPTTAAGRQVAKRATDIEMRERARALALQRMGYGAWVPEGGRVGRARGWFARAFGGEAGVRTMVGERYEDMPFREARQLLYQEQMAQALTELTSALRDNREATRENANVTATGRQGRPPSEE